MQFIISASSDIGIKKSTNQDSLSVKRLQTPQGEMVFAILCDGMGGLEKGEVASATVIKRYNQWVLEELGTTLQAPDFAAALQTAWTALASELNQRIRDYGKRSGIGLGTTLTAILIYQDSYYIINVGDSRIYQIDQQLQVLTQDHSVVARAVAMGEITPEQAKVDPRRNIILQCIGASEEIYPDFFVGKVQANQVFMLCSDGFIHELENEELYGCLNPSMLTDQDRMKYYTDYLIEQNKQRHETDNISVITIRTV